MLRKRGNSSIKFSFWGFRSIGVGRNWLRFSGRTLIEEVTRPLALSFGLRKVAVKFILSLPLSLPLSLFFSFSLSLSTFYPSLSLPPSLLNTPFFNFSTLGNFYLSNYHYCFSLILHLRILGSHSPQYPDFIFS